MPPACVDLVITDPPYLVKYRSRSGQTILNDEKDDWLGPAFTEISRVMKRDTFLVSFYGWHKVDKFFAAWRKAGFYTVGHLVWTKTYPSNSQYVAYHHEVAYLLAKGRPAIPESPLPDVLPWHYSGNKLHPMEKSVENLEPLVRTYSEPGALVLDPFCGSGSTAEAAFRNDRHYVGIELDPQHWRKAYWRMNRLSHAR
jgi:site-specific DNA-methyltransferase (adenine-specific)